MSFLNPDNLKVGDWVEVVMEDHYVQVDNGKVLQIEDAKLSPFGSCYVYRMSGQEHDDWYASSYLKKVDTISVFDIEI